ncbi:endonuclease/exonuclease/phosphatase family protein [Halalkalicoccus subterraneus]|uniref:endonuclease/exonuclease/phosphatase family protein n=1 Tax=Halalkalicoccus subterraneus TaxID=2675002 RepID=UPI000EFC2D38|nr:endonuclease/exonuclease/phosphatase family protein [Halalkalicoccus subterraneus]
MNPVPSISRRRFILGSTAALGSLVTPGLGAASSRDRSVRTVTFNIRYSNPEDEYPWEERIDRVTGTIRDLNPDLLGLQEAQPNQWDDLREELDEFEWHGVGRDDGEREGEFAPLAWRPDRFEMLETGEFWFSETPNEPGSVGWDADLPRVAVWARLRDRETDRLFWHINVHFDHIGERARLESAGMLRERAAAEENAGATVVVTGDLNANPYSEPYCLLLKNVLNGISSPLVDTIHYADSVDGPRETYHEFSDELRRRIDYILVSRDADVRSFRTLPIRVGEFRSDHLPIVTVLDP